MKRVPAIYVNGDRNAAERFFRSECVGNFRTPLQRCSPSQVASEMALAAGGTIFIVNPELFTRGSIKHIAYLHRHMNARVAPTVVMLFEALPFNQNVHAIIHTLFKQTISYTF